MTASTANLTDAQLVDLHTLVRDLTMQLRPDRQQQMLLNDWLLLDNDDALHWFVTHANDTWRIQPPVFQKLLQDSVPRLRDAARVDFLQERPTIADEATFIYRTHVWSIWKNKRRLAERVMPLVQTYGSDYLLPAVEPLVRAGALDYAFLQKLPLNLDPQTDRRCSIYNIWGASSFTSKREALEGLVLMGHSSEEKLQEFDALWEENFDHWLKTLLSSAEYHGLFGMAPSLRAALYPDIHENGPELLWYAYHDRVAEQIIY